MKLLFLFILFLVGNSFADPCGGGDDYSPKPKKKCVRCCAFETERRYLTVTKTETVTETETRRFHLIQTETVTSLAVETSTVTETHSEEVVITVDNPLPDRTLSATLVSSDGDFGFVFFPVSPSQDPEETPTASDPSESVPCSTVLDIPPESSLEQSSSSLILESVSESGSAGIADPDPTVPSPDATETPSDQ